MTDSTDTPDGWTEQSRPPCLFRRFDFDDYGQTRAFLDRAADLSEENGIFPDISFGRAYANVTVRPPGDNMAVGAAERGFALRLSALATPQDERDEAS